MFSEEELEFFRHDQENILFDNVACATIFRFSPENEYFDTDTLVRELGTKQIVYEGKIFVQPTTRTYERMFTQGEQRAISRTYITRITYPSLEVYVNDSIYIESCSDVFLQGKTLTVIDVQASTHSIDRRMISELNLG